jgi:hypothetical protein
MELSVGEKFTHELKNIKERVATWVGDRYRNKGCLLEEVERNMRGW